VGLVALFALIALPLAFALRDAMESPSTIAALEITQPAWPFELAAAWAGGGSALPFELGGLVHPAIDVPQPFPGTLAPLVAAGILYVGVWLFLTGGIVDRLARGRPTRGPAFFAACGRHAPRLFRLALLAAVPYGILLLVAAPVAAPSAAGQIGVTLAVAAISVVVDFARVRIVVEDRLSAVGALAAGWRFVRRRWLRVALFAVLNGGALAAVAALAAIASGSGGVLVLVGVAARLVGRLGVLAAEVTYFQQSLAHAGYVAGPPLTWPDSPAEEAIRNLAGASRPLP